MSRKLSLLPKFTSISGIKNPLAFQVYAHSFIKQINHLFQKDIVSYK